jgi:hypothetical protein
MDYHFDWLYASLQLADRFPHDADLKDQPFESPDFRLPKAKQPVYVNENQEDIDLLVAFETVDTTHLVLVEAKGATSWSNAQLNSKLGRMKTIFDPDAKWSRSDVQPHLVLISPRARSI